MAVKIISKHHVHLRQCINIYCMHLISSDQFHVTIIAAYGKELSIKDVILTDCYWFPRPKGTIFSKLNGALYRFLALLSAALLCNTGETIT